MSEIRNELGLSQSQLTEIVGGTKEMISDYERGRRKIPAKSALLLEFILETHRLGGNIQTVANRARQD